MRIQKLMKERTRWWQPELRLPRINIPYLISSWSLVKVLSRYLQLGRGVRKAQDKDFVEIGHYKYGKV